MNYSFLLKLLAFQSTVSLASHFTKQSTLLEAAVISVVCVLAYAVGESVIRKDFDKTDVKKGILIGIFSGLVSQVAVLFMPYNKGLISLVAIGFCVSPVQLWGLITNVLKRKSDKL